MRRPVEFIFSHRDVRPAVLDILLFFDVLLITHRGGDGAFCPSARRRRRRFVSLRNAREIETWWRFTRTKTDRLLREFNRLMTACRRWHLMIGGCALLLRVSLSLFLFLFLCLFIVLVAPLTRHRMLVIAQCFRVCSRTFWKRNRNPNVLLSLKRLLNVPSESFPTTSHNYMPVYNIKKSECCL